MNEATSPSRRWRWAAAWWLLSWAVVVVILAWSLHGRANPWVLRLTIPSGVDEQSYAGVGQFGFDIHRADLTADGKWLAVGRPNSQCEVWDLNALRRIAVLGAVSAPPASDKYPATEGARQARWFADGKHVAVNRAGGWKVFALDGQPVELPPGVSNLWYAAPSPIGLELAATNNDRVTVIDVATGQSRYDWKLDYYNGGARRVAWTRDAHYLLVNDYLGVRVWDLRTGELTFFHRELDLRLPAPMIADDHSGVHAPPTTQRGEIPKDLEYLRGSSMEDSVRTPPTQVAALVDSQFSTDGSFVASLYQTEGIDPWAAGDPGTCRLRFYATATGALLWDQVLPQQPRSMAFSPDGTRLSVILYKDFASTLQVYNTANHELLRTMPYNLTHRFPAGVMPLPDNRCVASIGSELWLVDTQEEYVPLRLLGSPSPAEVLVTPNGRRLVEVGMDKTVRLWEQRRPMSHYGAYVLPETWAIYAAFLLLVLGLAVIAGRDEARVLGRGLPAALWVAAVMLGIGLALNLADQVIGLAVDHLYDQNLETPSWHYSAVKWCMNLMFIGGIVGLMRLRRGWWRFEVVVLASGLIAVLFALGFCVWALEHGLPLPPGMPGSAHGWRLAMGLPQTLLWLILALAWMLMTGWLLLRPGVRALYRQRIEEGAAPAI